MSCVWTNRKADTATSPTSAQAPPTHTAADDVTCVRACVRACVHHARARVRMCSWVHVYPAHSDTVVGCCAGTVCCSRPCLQKLCGPAHPATPSARARVRASCAQAGSGTSELAHMCARTWAQLWASRERWTWHCRSACECVCMAGMCGYGRHKSGCARACKCQRICLCRKWCIRACVMRA